MKKVILIFAICVLILLTSTFAFANDEIPRACTDLNLDEICTHCDVTAPATREEFCELAYSMLCKSNMIDYDYDEISPFLDCNNDSVIALYNEGIIMGKGDGLFAPNVNITREEAAVILERIANHMELGYTKMYVEYKDNANISDWAKTAVQAVTNLGVMNGVGNNTFEPKEDYTIEHAIITLNRLYGHISKEETQTSFADKIDSYMPKNTNYMFSPISIKMALMMAANGADGKTKEEILNAFGVDDLQQYDIRTQNMIENYAKSQAFKLNISNSIWINSDNTYQRFSDEYTNKMSDYFDATSDIVNRSNALHTINGWVNEKTNGKIDSIISEDNLSFCSMLINAVYFKANWQNEFYKSSTYPDIFYERDGEQSKIDFMHITDSFGYADNNGVKIVKLPYVSVSFDARDNAKNSTKVNMYLMISDNEFEPEKTLNGSKFQSQRIRLSVPKFKIEYCQNIVDILHSLGIEKAFGTSAEFENMFDRGTMKITDVLHKTYIDVDEEGTEAAAVTSVIMKATAAPIQPIEVKFDRPFSFVIRDDTNEEILFMGEYAYGK